MRSRLSRVAAAPGARFVETQSRSAAKVQNVSKFRASKPATNATQLRNAKPTFPFDLHELLNIIRTHNINFQLGKAIN